MSLYKLINTKTK